MTAKKTGVMAEKLPGSITLIASFSLIVGWGYWMWLAAKFGSIAMFALRVFFPFLILSAMMGLWSLLFEIPAGLLNLVR
jgi:hypothetical protein